MKCISCETEINPKWKHAIDQNICPFCGQSIMEELLKGLLSTLQQTMEKLQTYPDQLNDWLHSNYSYIKTDSPEIINYVPREALKEMKREIDQEDFDRKKKIIKVKTERGEEEVVTQKVQSDSQTAGFFERAEIIKRGNGGDGSGDGDNDFGDTDDEGEGVQLNPIQPIRKSQAFKSAAEKTRHLKKLKEKIEKEGTQAVIGEVGLASMIDPDNLENADPEMVAAFQSEIGDGDIITSAIPDMGDDEDAMTSRILAANLAAAKGKGKNAGGGYNESDVRALQEMHQRVAKSKRSFEDGENRGKGGFSRA